MRGRTSEGSITGNGTRSSCCLPMIFFAGNGGGSGSSSVSSFSFSGSSGTMSIFGEICPLQKKNQEESLNLGVKKIPVVPVLYREKIRVGRSEIIFFLNIFFMVLAVFLLGDLQ
jgi:hypothetical protein